MAYLFQPNYVCYACNCGSLKPISKIYFCRHCLKIRCGYCVCQEVDSHYCQNCVETLPSSEVRLKKNKCSNCFDCPCCFQTLSTKAGHVPIRPNATGEDNKDIKATPRKVYYLFCASCRWSSRDVGIPDQPVATGGWPEQENPHTVRINALMDFHKILASREKQQKEKKKSNVPKRSFYPFDSFGLSSAAVRKRIGRPLITSGQTQSADQPPASEALEEVEELSEDIFTQKLDIMKITTIEQRLKYPEVQAERLNELRPQHRQFMVKRSQRCRVCEHNVSKPEVCAQSTKFKIQLSAFYHVPEVKIVTCEPLKLGKTSELLLKICNPTQHHTQISFLSLDSSLTPQIPIETEKDVKQENIQGCESPSLLPSMVRQVAVVEDPKKINVKVGGELSLPENILVLPPRDDTAEYDDLNFDSASYRDDRKMVVWRKGNKAVIKLQVTPFENSENRTESLIVGFVMQYRYVNTIATLEHKKPQKLDLRVKLYLDLGKLAG